MKKLLTTITIAATAASHALAGSSPNSAASSTVTGGAAPASNSALAGQANATCILPHNGIAIGYDSEFLCRGMEMGEDLLWARTGVSLPLADELSLGLSLWYGEATDNGLRELDGIANLAYDLGPVTLGLNFKWYHYEEHGESMHHDDMGMGEMMMMPMANDYFDLGPSITAHLGPIDVTAAYAYEFESEGHFFEVFASAEIPLCSRASLVPSAGIGYTSNWMMPGEGWNNMGLRMDLPITLVEHLSLTPYIAANFPLEALEAHQDNLFVAGVKLQYSW